MPALPNSASSEPRVLEIQVPASALQENKLHAALTATNIIQSIMNLPTSVAAAILQQHINAVLSNSSLSKQVDGAADTSDEDASDVSDDNLDNDDDDDNLAVSQTLKLYFQCKKDGNDLVFICRKTKKKRKVAVTKKSHCAVMMMFLKKKTKMTCLTQIM